ncbi:bacterio-opsin activator domain-containing protein [Halostella litorea]|uniref:bacterio-opsin activator domain-containing protein n=1 Tax=Halostella litorea TaxID=2528831 RepID=UPI0010927496|nr:bacterio-opsin activator domain-containing protein [Halostella litorea]
MASLATAADSATRTTVLYVGERTAVVSAAAELFDADLRNADASRRAALDRMDADVDCLVVDASLPDGRGVDLLAAVRRTYPELAGVVLVESGPVPEIGSKPPTDYVRVADGAEPLATRIRNVLSRRAPTGGLADHLFDSAVRNGPDAVVVVDDRTEIRFANEAVADVFGYDPAAVVGSPVTDLVPTERREPFLEAFARHVVDGSVGEWTQVRGRGRHRNGRDIPLSLSFHHGRYEGGRLFTAIVREESERRDREATLERQRDELAELDRINRLIREVAHVLIDATSRSEMEQAVCDLLADSGPYAFAWIGRENLARNRVIPRFEAGAAEGYLDAVSDSDYDTLSDGGPAAQAVIDRSVTVVDDVGTDERFEPWREDALDRGLRSVATVPVQYEETVLGVLALYEEEVGAFDEREAAVLEEVGRLIGYAMTAVDRKEALVADDRTELEFRLTDDDHFFTGVTAGTDVEVTFEGMTPRTEESDLVYATVRGGSPEAIRDAAADAAVVEDATALGEHEDGVGFEFTTTDDTVAATLASYGASVVSMRAADGSARIVAELPATADVRSVVEAVTAEFDGMELLAQRDRQRTEARDGGGPGLWRADLLGSLTERQRTVLETAYRSGYFQWPRERTAEEVADSLGITSPTLHNHLRLAQGELFGALFEGD